MPGILFGTYVTHFIFVLGGIVRFIWQIKKKKNWGSENLNNSLANRCKNSGFFFSIYFISWRLIT